MHDFFDSVDSQLIITLLYDCLNLVVDVFHLWAVAAIAHKTESLSFVLQQLIYVVYTMHRCTVLLKDTVIICDTFDGS